jgi:hypothetical protein
MGVRKLNGIMGWVQGDCPLCCREELTVLNFWEQQS